MEGVKLGNLYATLGIDTRGLKAAAVGVRRFARQAEGQIAGVTRSLTGLRGAFLGLGSIYGAGKLLGKFEAYQSAVVDMRRVTKRSFDQIKADVGSLDKALGSGTELLHGYYQVISAGVKDPIKALNLLTVAAKGAKAAHVGQAETVKALTKLLEGYGGEIKNATEASDLLFAMEREGQTTFSELVPIIGDLAKLSHNAHISTDELAASLSLITKTAGSTAEAATQYKALIVSMMRENEQMRKVLTALHEPSALGMIEKYGWAETLKRIKEKALDLNINLMKLFRTSEGLMGLLALSGNKFKTLEEALVAVRDRIGLTDEAFERWKKSFEGIKTTFYNTIGSVFTKLGSVIAPVVQEAMRSIASAITGHETEITRTFRNLIDLSGRLATSLAAIAKYAGLRSIMLTFAEGTKYAKKGLLDLEKFKHMSPLERQRIVDEIYFGSMKYAVKGKHGGQLVHGKFSTDQLVDQTAYWIRRHDEEKRLKSFASSFVTDIRSVRGVGTTGGGGGATGPYVLPAIHLFDSAKTASERLAKTFMLVDSVTQKTILDKSYISPYSSPDRALLPEIGSLADLRSSTDEVINKFDLVDSKFDMVAKDSKSMFDDMREAMKGWANDWARSLNDVVWGAKTSFNDILQSFAMMITQMSIQKSIVEPLFAGLSGGGLLGGIGKAIGGLFGGGSSVAPTPVSSKLLDSIDLGIGGLTIGPGRASGGSVFPGIAYPVGERGPEIFTPGVAGRITPFGGNVEVNVIDNSGNDIHVEQGVTAQGGPRIDVIIDEIIADKIGGVSKTSKALRNTFGLSPQLARR